MLSAVFQAFYIINVSILIYFRCEMAPSSGDKYITSTTYVDINIKHFINVRKIL